MGFFVSLLIFCIPFNVMFIHLPEPVGSFPRPQPQEDTFAFNYNYKWPEDFENSASRRAMKRQHQIVANKLEKKPVRDDPEGKANGGNIRGGNSEFRYIPPKNHRQVLAKDFSHQTGQKREETRRNFMKIIQERVPIFENKKKVQELEYRLLDKGLFGICKWFFPLPPPLDKDEQCTQHELHLLLERNFLLFGTGGDNDMSDRDKDKSVDVWSEHMD